MNEPQRDPSAAKLARLKRTVLALACVLVVGGLVVLFALPRVPMPLRIMVGLTDLFGGLVLLVLLRQNR